MVINAVLLVLLQVFIAMKLQHSIDWDFKLVFSPFFILEGFYFLTKLIAGFMSVSALRSASTNGTADTSGKTLNRLLMSIANTLLMSALRITFGVLIALKLDKDLTVSWWVIFTPVWIYIFCIIHPSVSFSFKKINIIDSYSHMKF